MLMTSRSLLGVLLTVAVAATVRAQQGAPVHPVGTIVARTQDSIVSVGYVRVLSDGRVFISDYVSHRLMLCEATLAHCRVVMDAVGTAERSYGTARLGGFILPFTGDSTLFYDAPATALVV